MLKLMLLGGAKHQVPVIEKAKEKGIFTILCDYLPDNPGRLVADCYYAISSLDQQAVLDVARHEQIDGILAYASDPASRTAAFVSEALGLKTNSYQTVETLTNKGKFRQFLSENGFAVPKAFTFHEMSEAEETLSTLDGIYVVKPADASGSKGISRVTRTEDAEHVRRKFKAAFDVSFTHEIVLEEWVTRDGYQVAGDGFVIGGELIFRCFGNSHFNVNGVNPFAPIGASFPSVHSDETLERVHATLQRMITRVGMNQGPLNFDIFVKGDDVYLMDIGPRNGGNYIPQIIEQATGVDLVEATINLALGKEVLLEQRPVTVPSSYFILGSQQNGKFEGITFAPGDYTVVATHFNVDIGADVYRFEGANRALGSLIVSFPNVVAMIELLDHPENWISIHVTPDRTEEGSIWTSSSQAPTVF